MKLIDCLLEVLPSHGGWKPGADFVAVSFGEAKFYSEKCGWLSTIEGVVDGMEGMKVNREEYEQALAKSNRPAWSGEGLPPVGCECEFFNGDRYDCRGSVPKDGAKVKIVAHDKSEIGTEIAVFTWTGMDGALHAEACTEMLFRPIRTEAERKREDVIAAMQLAIAENEGESFMGAIYSAIAAGKIPHITLK